MFRIKAPSSVLADPPCTLGDTENLEDMRNLDDNELEEFREQGNLYITLKSKYISPFKADCLLKAKKF